MGDWKLLGSILEEVHIHSTIVGKIWLTILFIFRMLILGTAAEDVWKDEQTKFVCNTDQPGCKAVCYDSAFPISLVRFWVMQVISVSAPSLVYMGHALYRLRALEKERIQQRARLKEELGETEGKLEDHRRVERELKKLDEKRRVKKVPLRGSLLRTYVIHILIRSVVEVSFLLGQYHLYGWHLAPLFRCERYPCPNTVDCYVSRPTEKTIFMVFMMVIGVVSLFLNVLEISHLGVSKIKRTLCREKYTDDDDDELKRKPTIQHLCVLSNLSPSGGPLTQTVVKVVPDDERKVPHNVGLKASHEALRHNSVAHPGYYQANCYANRQPRLSLQPSRPSQGGATLAPQPTEVGDTRTHPTLADNRLPPRGVPPPSSTGEGGGPGKSQVHYGDPHLRERLQQPSHMETLVPSTAVHRPSLAIRELEEEEEIERRDSFRFTYPRKASFMVRSPDHDTMSIISGSTAGSSEESDELGSLHGNMPMMPPPGRRMSMSVFLDISSIMKK